ncbi:MAG: asparagine synthetase B [Gemmatimonadota bacterium]|nr:asparagine synthetase B [Gemmatimonadota bacterium]
MSGAAVWAGAALRAGLAVLLVVAAPASAAAQMLLVPMDRSQDDHLRAYGLVYEAIAAGARAEWLLNYRDGSFLLPGQRRFRDRAALLGVTVEPVDGGALARLRTEMAAGNRETVPLETAPRIAVYTPPNASPWDDAVTLALEYAGIPYETVWDPEVLRGRLAEYDWLHLHHEDFTGQYSRFPLSYAGAAWLAEEIGRNEETAAEFGFPTVPALKKAVAREIRAYVQGGGLLFAMCTATETLDLALAAEQTDIAASYADGSPAAPDAAARMLWDRTLAFRDAELALAPTSTSFSDIDGHQVNTPRRLPLGSFELFPFSAPIDPVPAMLTQSHEQVLPDFYGLTTSFRPERLRPGVTVLARDPETGLVKYLHGGLGSGSFTFLGGHDPEDPQHLVGDPPTDLALERNSAGYRLILNNVLYPAARRKALKT